MTTCTEALLSRNGWMLPGDGKQRINLCVFYFSAFVCGLCFYAFNCLYLNPWVFFLPQAFWREGVKEMHCGQLVASQGQPNTFSQLFLNAESAFDLCLRPLPAYPALCATWECWGMDKALSLTASWKYFTNSTLNHILSVNATHTFPTHKNIS